uniref:Uncharacterized protein n=1 Tax=Aegilops tauschii subsp. strangulata TaxID=200361 RepID=A0A453MTA2_AEGTS
MQLLYISCIPFTLFDNILLSEPPLQFSSKKTNRCYSVAYFTPWKLLIIHYRYFRSECKSNPKAVKGAKTCQRLKLGSN